MTNVKLLATSITTEANEKKMCLRVTIPFDSADISNLIDIACCYNAEWYYRGKELFVEVFNLDYIEMLFNEYYTYLFEK